MRSSAASAPRSSPRRFTSSPSPLAGSPHPGTHRTARRARRACGATAYDYAMYFDSPRLRTVLLSVHVPLREAHRARSTPTRIAALARLTVARVRAAVRTRAAHRRRGREPARRVKADASATRRTRSRAAWSSRARTASTSAARIRRTRSSSRATQRQVRCGHGDVPRPGTDPGQDARLRATRSTSPSASPTCASPSITAPRSTSPAKGSPTPRRCGTPSSGPRATRRGSPDEPLGRPHHRACCILADRSSLRVHEPPAQADARCSKSSTRRRRRRPDDTPLAGRRSRCSPPRPRGARRSRWSRHVLDADRAGAVHLLALHDRGT